MTGPGDRTTAGIDELAQSVNVWAAVSRRQANAWHDCSSAVSTRLDAYSRGDIPRQGETRTYARTFTLDDVRAFAGVSHDHGVHHVELDPHGRLIVHGLLTATIPTKLGGDLDYLAQDMSFRFHRPVYTDDRVECLCTATVVEDRGDRTYIEFDLRCSNQDGKDVLTGGTKGIILRR